VKRSIAGRLTIPCDVFTAEKALIKQKIGLEEYYQNNVILSG